MWAMSLIHRLEDSRIRSLVATARDRLAQAGVDYGDVRWVDREQETLVTRNEDVDQVTRVRDVGVGVRVLLGGAWGYAATSQLTEANIGRTVEVAVAAARGQGGAARRPSALEARHPSTGRFATPITRCPFDDVSLEEKLDLLLTATRTMLGTPGIVAARGNTVSLRTHTWLMSTDGVDIAQRLQQTGGGITATAEHGGEVQQRSYPKHFEGNLLGGGWERVLALDLTGNAARVAAEAVELSRAPACPAVDAATIILDGSILSLQVHESCGHPTELDRALGEEISLAGGSFLTPDRLGEDFEYGAPIVNLYADSTSEGGCGTFGWDDEGTPAHRTDIVRAGRFVGYHSGREAAARVGVPAAGSLRADGWRNVPIVRMINLNLEPGSWRLDDLIADTDHGYYISGSKSWSIDDLRINFQFGCESAREIRGGKLGRVLKNPIYTGITPRFWRGCDAICNQDAWQMWGFLQCGKGDPMQLMHVSHGVAPARFRGVRLGG